MAVLDKDIFAAAPRELLAVPVAMTVLGGRIVYKR
jgi:predicted amidohydrolase YtcJ